MVITVALSLMAGLAFAAEGDKKGKGKAPADPAKRAEMMLKECDKDANQKLSKEEYAASKAAQGMKAKGGDEAVEKSFKARDKDCDGFLCKDELAAAARQRQGQEGREGSEMSR